MQTTPDQATAHARMISQEPRRYCLTGLAPLIPAVRIEDRSSHWQLTPTFWEREPGPAVSSVTMLAPSIGSATPIDGGDDQ